MSKPLSDRCIRASWEAVRKEIRHDLLHRDVPFNPRHVDKFIDNFIDSMVFAKRPCTDERGIAAAWEVYKREIKYRLSGRGDESVGCEVSRPGGSG